MSRMTRNINQIVNDLNRISGLDGIAADEVAKYAEEIHKMVEDVLKNHSESSLFDYEGKRL